MEKIRQYTRRIEAAVGEQFLNNEPESLYEPARYILGLGGKRLRAALALAGAELYGADPEEAMPAALAIEVFHNFSLLHDDIMDAAPLRRGAATVHEKWNTNTAILSGDMMLVKSYELLQQLPAAVLPAVLNVFTRTAIEVCEGQQYDMDFENAPEVSEEEYLRMIRLKTSVLIGGALKIGALIGRASEAEAQKLYQFGTNIGLAFQMQDDLLDAFGDTAKVGKQAGGDILSDKKTLLMIIAKKSTHPLLNKASSAEGAEKIKLYRRIFNETGARTYTDGKKEEYFRKALRSLEEIKQENSLKEELKEFAFFLINREN